MRRWPTAALAAAGALALGGAGVWRASVVRAGLYERVERRLEGNAASTEAAVERWIEERRYDAATVAGEVAPALPRGGRPNLALLDPIVHRVRDGHGYVDVWVIDSAGHLIGSAGAGAPHPAEYRAARASLADGRAHLCDPFRGDDGRLTLCYVASADAAGGASAGITVGAASPFVVVLRSTPYGSLVPLLKSSAAGGGTERGRLVARVGDSLVVIGGSDRPHARAALEQEPWATAPAVFVRAVSGQVAHGLVPRPDGRVVIAGARHVAGTEWAVVRQVDRSEIDSVLASQLRGEALLLAAVLLAVGCGAALVSRAERTRRLREVAASEARLVDTLRSSLDPVIAVDDALQITFFNGAAERTYGCPAHEAIGKPLVTFIPPALRETHLANLRAWMASATPSLDFGGRETSFAMRADGTWFPVEGVITRAGAGDQRIYTFIVRDVTERVRHQAEREATLSLLRATLESTADGLLVVDLDERVTAYNRKFLDIWGISEELVRGGDDEAMVAAARRQIREPKEFADRVRALYADPSLEGYDVLDLVDGRKVERVSRPQRVGDRVVGRVWSFRDVTARELAANALRRSEASARAFVERSPYGICRVTLDGRVMTANPALVDMLGHPSEESLLRTDVGALFAEPGARAALVRRHEAGEDSVCGEAIWRRLDGGTMPVRVTSQRVRDARGASLHFLCYVENLAPLRTAENALRQAEKLAAVGQFVSGVAHELNNPLAAVLLFSEGLLEECATDRERETLVLLQEQASRARAIVRDLLSFVRGSDGDPTTLPAAEVLAHAVRALERQALSAGSRVDYVSAGDLGWVRVDRVAIEQVLTNLVVNALQAAPGGTVRVVASATPTELRVAVEDEGPGIPRDVLPRVFEPFFTTKPVGMGTGLGLSVSLGIAERHGGTLRAENREAPHDRGARLVLALPLVDGPAVAHTGVAAPAAVESAVAGPRRVLVVDDEEAIRRALARFFVRRGWEVDEAADGGPAFDRLVDGAEGRAPSYDLVISDLRMPGVSGAALHDRVAERYPDLLDRLIFATGDLVSPEAAEFVERTSCPVLEKPFRFATLDGLVERATTRAIAS
ncbi:PAS sensor protein [Gemmatirosa kalamazoonensis]|uniref:histidine kinase n=1 Tax=Gemmatirosa kalamazoonensis TaxID=861299 RepID=W0RIA3_9BACT|nr:PAS domain S-box protein [Gemmatirosa kalamazoonensis]AHG90065.1 PAS sensor protein [Gemmatirosa kalamazoonensis]